MGLPPGASHKVRALGHVRVSRAASMADIAALADTVRAELGRIDHLFINHGIAGFAELGEVTEESWDRQFAVNTKGAFFTVQALAPLIEDGGSVVFTTVANDAVMPGLSAYSASQEAMRAFAHVLAVELVPRRIRVNSVAPGQRENRSGCADRRRRTMPVHDDSGGAVDPRDLTRTISEARDSPDPSVAEHVRRYLATNGASGYREGGMTNLVLTHRGRTSGALHRTGLFFGEDDGRYVLVASGSAITHTHPHWYLNVTANPEVRVQILAERFAARARTVEGPERERLWALMARLAPVYRTYEARTRRVIPVVVLDRVPSAASAH